MAIAHYFHSIEMGKHATGTAILVGERQGLRLTRHICNPY